MLNAPENNHINEFSSVNFNCSSQGYPIPDIKWKFNGQDLTNFSSYSTNSSKVIWLGFNRVERGHNGTYTCYLNENIKQDFDLIVKCQYFYFICLRGHIFILLFYY